MQAICANKVHYTCTIHHFCLYSFESRIDGPVLTPDFQSFCYIYIIYLVSCKTMCLLTGFNFYKFTFYSGCSIRLSYLISPLIHNNLFKKLPMRYCYIPPDTNSNLNITDYNYKPIKAIQP